MKRFRWLWVLLVLTLVVAAGAVLVTRKRTQLADAPKETARPAVVRTAVSRVGDIGRTRTYLGRVTAWQRAEVAGRITATVREVLVREGAPVKAGEPLVVLDAAELAEAVAAADARFQNAQQQAAALEARVRSLEASVAYWEKEWERDRFLAEEGAIARAQADATADRRTQALGELEAARSSLDAARSLGEAQRRQLEEARTRLGYAGIVSPFDGVVTRRVADPGTLAVPGQALLVIEDHGRMKVRFDVPERDLVHLGKGAALRVTQGQTALDLAVSRTFGAVNPDQTLTMEADLPPGVSLKPGAFCEVKAFLESLSGVVLVPEESLVPSPDGRTMVFAVENGRTRPIPVELLMTADGLAAVSGIEAGVTVVTSTYLGWNRLAAGEPVEAMP